MLLQCKDNGKKRKLDASVSPEYPSWNFQVEDQPWYSTAACRQSANLFAEVTGLGLMQCTPSILPQKLHWQLIKGSAIGKVSHLFLPVHHLCSLICAMRINGLLLLRIWAIVLSYSKLLDLHCCEGRVAHLPESANRRSVSSQKPSGTHNKCSDCQQNSTFEYRFQGCETGNKICPIQDFYLTTTDFLIGRQKSWIINSKPEGQDPSIALIGYRELTTSISSIFGISVKPHKFARDRMLCRSQGAFASNSLTQHVKNYKPHS